MVTPSKRAATQRFFEERFGVSTPEDLAPWRDDLRKIELTLADQELLSECIDVDIVASYERCAFTIYQAISDLHHGDRLWAAVKLYYSVFYALRAEILLSNYVIVRAGRFLILECRRGAKFSQFNGEAKGDHGLAIALAKRYHSGSDILQSQNIEGILSYEWLKSVREMVQYKLRRPPELDNIDPFFPDAQWSIFEQVKTFLADSDPYFCFDPDYAALALPLKRFQLTSQNVKSRNLSGNTDFFALLDKYYVEGGPCLLLKPFA